jgi:hypothetical protein
MKRAFLKAIVSGGIAALLAGCGDTTTWNRKLTVTVQTPNGDVQGSAVQKESITDKNTWWASPEARGAALGIIAGEAVIVEVKPGQYLFALLGQKPETFRVLLPGEAPLESATKLTAMRGAHILPASQYPLLVTFAEINNPKSVKEVKPDKLAEMFGPGLLLLRLRKKL